MSYFFPNLAISPLNGCSVVQLCKSIDQNRLALRRNFQTRVSNFGRSLVSELLKDLLQLLLQYFVIQVSFTFFAPENAVQTCICFYFTLWFVISVGADLN